jgi:hypothetical protein
VSLVHYSNRLIGEIDSSHIEGLQRSLQKGLLSLEIDRSGVFTGEIVFFATSLLCVEFDMRH